MAKDFQEKDTLGDCSVAAYCSSDTPNAGAVNRKATSGIAGIVETSITLAASVTDRIVYEYEVEPDEADWPAGAWVIRADVTSGNKDIDITDIFICRVNALCVNQGLVGSLTGLTELASAIVHIFTVSGSAQAAAIESDNAIAIIVCANNAMSSRTIGITPSQLITAPFGIEARGLHCGRFRDDIPLEGPLKGKFQIA